MINNNITFLINASNLKNGGGLQVADSIWGQLNKFSAHRFLVVLSHYLERTEERIKDYDNVNVVCYDIPDSFRTIVLGCDSFLDELVLKNEVQAVLTVFGLSRWRPKVPHLSGFALPQLVIPESPYFKRKGKAERTKLWLWCRIRQWSLKRSADDFWTENPYISDRLSALIRGVNCDVRCKKEDVRYGCRIVAFDVAWCGERREAA